MGAPRVTPEEIVEMHRLNRRLGTYSAVGREIGRAGSTVSKYIQMRGVSDNIRVTVYNLLNETA